jgi:hypothetical protein
MILTLESNDRYRLSRIYERVDSEVKIVYGLHTKIRMIRIFKCWELWNSGIKAVSGLRMAIHMFGAPEIVVIYRLKIILLLRRASQSSSGTMRMCWELTERSSWELRRVCSDTRGNVDSIQFTNSSTPLTRLDPFLFDAGLVLFSNKSTDKCPRRTGQ